MRARPLIALAAVAALVALLVFGLVSKGDSGLAVGDPVPDKELPRLEGGGALEIADFRGRWVLVNLWASWCAPCRVEAPDLERFADDYRDRKLTVLGINVQDNSKDARAFVREFDLSYPQVRSVGDERNDAFGARGVPENFLVDPRGRLALIWRGYVDRRFLEENVVPLIEGRA